MKKLIYLLTILISFAVTSCTSDDAVQLRTESVETITPKQLQITSTGEPLEFIRVQVRSNDILLETIQVQDAFELNTVINKGNNIIITLKRDGAYAFNYSMSENNILLFSHDVNFAQGEISITESY